MHFFCCIVLPLLNIFFVYFDIYGHAMMQVTYCVIIVLTNDMLTFSYLAAILVYYYPIYLSYVTDITIIKSFSLIFLFNFERFRLIYLLYMSRLMIKQTMWFLNRSDTNWPVHLQKMDRHLKFQILEEEELYFPHSENKGADQLCSYCTACNCTADLRLCFRIGKNPDFS